MKAARVKETMINGYLARSLLFFFSCYLECHACTGVLLVRMGSHWLNFFSG